MRPYRVHPASLRLHHTKTEPLLSPAATARLRREVTTSQEEDIRGHTHMPLQFRAHECMKEQERKTRTCSWNHQYAQLSRSHPIPWHYSQRCPSGENAPVVYIPFALGGFSICPLSMSKLWDSATSEETMSFTTGDKFHDPQSLPTYSAQRRDVWSHSQFTVLNIEDSVKIFGNEENWAMYPSFAVLPAE